MYFHIEFLTQIFMSTEECSWCHCGCSIVVMRGDGLYPQEVYLVLVRVPPDKDLLILWKESDKCMRNCPLSERSV